MNLGVGVSRSKYKMCRKEKLTFYSNLRVLAIAREVIFYTFLLHECQGY